MAVTRKIKSMTGRGNDGKGKPDRRRREPAATPLSQPDTSKRADGPGRPKQTYGKAAAETLRQSEASYRSLFENIPDGIYRTTPDGQILSANPALVRMFGYENEEEFKRKFRANQLYLRPADREKYLQLLEAEDEIHNNEITLKRKDGSLLIALENVRRQRDAAGNTLFYEGVLTDITERKQIEDDLKESEALNRAILDNSPIGISVRSSTGRLLSANSAWKKIWAISEAELARDVTIERSTLKFDESDNYLLAHQLDVRRVFEEGGYLHLPELQNTHARPSAAEWIAQHFYAIQDAGGQVKRVVILTEDITERKHTETALRETNGALQQALEREQTFSRTDSLTGVSTRRYFFEVTGHELEASKRYHRPLSILMFDIDHLKEFNDTYGHQAGDEMLKTAARIANLQLRGADFLARYGGDEFVILLSNSNGKQALQAAERIRDSVASHQLEMDGSWMNITLSLGIAEYLNEADTVDQLVQRADRALYRAKQTGRNCAVVYQEWKDSPPSC
jgi:diguanylate cyclase (GGDEF)-like protein/PAS domain S-box-containing protein